MRLEPNTIDLNVCRLERSNGVDGTLGTGTTRLDTVVVVVELDVGLCLLDGLLGSLKGNGEESRANDLVEGVRLVPAAGAVEGFVDNVPGVAAAAPVLNQVGDVVLEDADHGLVGDAAGHEVKEPGRVLVVPAQVVAAHVLAVVLGNVNDDVTTGVGEVVALGLRVLPLHVVGGGDGAEDAGVVEDGHVLKVLLFRAGNVGGGTEPELAVLLGNVVEEGSTVGSIVCVLVDGDILRSDERSWRSRGGIDCSNGGRSGEDVLEGRHVEE